MYAIRSYYVSRVVVCVIISLFPIIVNTLFGLLSADKGMHDLFTLHHASRYTRLRWRSQGRLSVPMVLRAPYGGGVRALEHHSESRESYFAHTPGLKMVMPSSPRNNFV